MHTKKEVLNEALSLPPIERAALIEELLSSFEFPDRKRLDKQSVPQWTTCDTHKKSAAVFRGASGILLCHHHPAI